MGASEQAISEGREQVQINENFANHLGRQTFAYMGLKDTIHVKSTF